MQRAEIDPLTGGLVFVKEEEEEQEIQRIQKAISNINKPVTFDLNANFNPIPSQ